jgi:GTPase involved in cell partitioning and DNA repair
MFAKSGTRGGERDVILELKMLADVGLIGYPSVGKSSILSKISAAKPKIADYHFTTLSPNLGVVKTPGGGRGFVAADIPGLIEGAADGAGLGHAFLRHVDRCRLLLHVVDIASVEYRDPVEDIKLIDTELERYSPELATRPQVIVANKYDLVDPDVVDLPRFEEYCASLGRQVIFVSAMTGEGLDDLLQALTNALPPDRRRVSLLLPFSKGVNIHTVATAFHVLGCVCKDKIAFIHKAIIVVLQPFNINMPKELRKYFDSCIEFGMNLTVANNRDALFHQVLLGDW